MWTKKRTIGLWVVQGLLASLFVFAGSMKLILPVEALTQQVALPGWFLRFIGTCEVLGAIGLVLPAALRIVPILTPVAATGLAAIMSGAVIVTAVAASASQAIVPLIVGLACAVVIYGRRPASPTVVHG